MILAGDSLMRIAGDSLDPAPYEKDVGPVSVDVHLADELQIQPGGYATGPAKEEIDMPVDVAALLTGRSSHMRQGLFMPGGMIDPGFSNQLELEFSNLSSNHFVIGAGEAAGRLTFLAVYGETEPYDGRWQG